MSLHCGGGDQFRDTMARIKKVTVASVTAGAVACRELAVAEIDAASTPAEAQAAHDRGARDCVTRLRAAYNAAAAAFNSALRARSALDDGRLSEADAAAAAREAYDAIVSLRNVMRELGLAGGSQMFDRSDPLPQLGEEK